MVGRKNSQTAIPRYHLLHLLRVIVVVVCAMYHSPVQGEVIVGVYFVESDEPIDFLTIPPFPPSQFIIPWQMTGATTQFVKDGALQNRSEQIVRSAVVSKVKELFYSVPTPRGFELDVDFLPQKVSGPGTVNVLLGKHNIEFHQWFGKQVYRGGLGNPQGESNAAVSIDRIDARLAVEFSQFDHAVGAVANVTAHEIGHLFGLLHVCAASGFPECDPDSPVVNDPYDVMATGPSGLPDTGWIAENIFTSIAETQPAKHSSVSLLIENLGIRKVGDLDRDGVIGNKDLGIGFGNFGKAGAVFKDGDVDHDNSVGNRDLGLLLGNFEGSISQDVPENAAGAQLIYNPRTGNVQLDARRAPGGVVTNFLLKIRTEKENLYPDVARSPFGDSLWTDSLLEISATDPKMVGFGGIHDLGNIFPANFDQDQLENFLSAAHFVGKPGSGVQTFHFVVVPEPGTFGILALGMGAVMLFLSRSRARIRR